MPGRNEMPAWQALCITRLANREGMRDMYDGRAKLEPLDNARYSGITWTSVREILEGRRDREEQQRRAS